MKIEQVSEEEVREVCGVNGEIVRASDNFVVVWSGKSVVTIEYISSISHVTHLATLYARVGDNMWLKFS